MILKGSVSSHILEMETGITVITPADIVPEQSRKVVYLLHGLYGGNGDWVNYTMLPYFAWDYRATFIMPEVARSFYTDMEHGQRFFTYITEELPRLCEGTFNISSKREDTAVIGVSMGGYGALKAALTVPSRYGCCCAMSSVWLFLKESLEDLRTERGRKVALARYGKQMVDDMHSIFGDDLAWRPDCELLELAKQTQQERGKPRIYCACGTEDYLRADNLRFAAEMEKLELDFTYEEWKGRHDWYFFNEALKKSLEFCFKD
ncbi:MAG: alpha/beta hydrolase-fold protein [Sphaerochaetaceae bacterium]|nr:alpha/beta hydrolase-fold protein [Sphaerochaetaceae bacterium]